MQTTKKNPLNLIIALLILTCTTVHGQDIKPYLQGEFTEHCVKTKLLLNGKILFLQLVLESPGGGFNTSYSDLPNQAFSQICISDFNGKIEKCLAFPDNDSTYHFAEYFELLDNGNIAIGGSINPPDNSATPFISVVNADLSSFVFLKQLQPLSGYTVSFNTLNDEIFISTESAIQQYNSAGLFLYTYLFNYDTISDPFFTDNSFFSFNNKLYYHYEKDLVDENKNFLVEIDELFNITEHQTNIFNDRPNNINLNLSRKGIALNQNYYINGTVNKKNDIAIKYPSIFKLDTSNNFTILYIDSTVESLEANTFHLQNQFDVFDENNIYSCFPYTDNLEHGILVYSITKDGTLNWKKKISLQNGQEFPNNPPTSTLSVNAENELFISIDIKDSLNKKDVYILKLDSNGNKIDFSTALFSLEPNLDINDFFLYPNPTKDVLNINSSLEGKYTLQIYNTQAKEIASFEFAKTTKINLEKLIQGNYNYRIVSKQGKVMQTGIISKK